MKVSSDAAVMGVALLAGAGLIWWATRPGVAGKAGAAAAAAVGEAAAGTVVGVGKWFGIPETSNHQCELDLAAGRLWDASFSCPAGVYAQALADRAQAAVFGSTALSAAEAADARREFAKSDPRRLDLQTDTGTSWDSTPGIY